MVFDSFINKSCIYFSPYGAHLDFWLLFMDGIKSAVLNILAY